MAGNNLYRDVDGTLHLYFFDGALGNQSPLYHSTSLDGGYTWSTPAVVLAANAVAWATGWANCSVWRAGAGDYRMIVESGHHVNPPGPQWALCYAKAPTAAGPWAIQGAGPLTSLQRGTDGTGAYGGPDLTVLPNGDLMLVYHAALSGSLPTDIYRSTASAADPTTWTTVPITPSLLHTGVDPAYDQVADPSLTYAVGKWFLVVSAVHNAASTTRIQLATYTPAASPTFVGEPGGAVW